MDIDKDTSIVIGIYFDIDTQIGTGNDICIYIVSGDGEDGDVDDG